MRYNNTRKEVPKCLAGAKGLHGVKLKIEPPYETPYGVIDDVAIGCRLLQSGFHDWIELDNGRTYVTVTDGDNRSSEILALYRVITYDPRESVVYLEDASRARRHVQKRIAANEAERQSLAEMDQPGQPH